jgi:uncharacterized protein (DUF885 family)
MGQSAAASFGYHLGRWYLLELRGGRDPRQLHEDVLAEGPLPLAVLGRKLSGEPPPLDHVGINP